MTSSLRSPRNVAAAILTTIPFLLVVVTWMIWRDTLPQTLPTQWSGEKVVSTQPTITVLFVSGATTLVAAAFTVSQAALPLTNYTSRLGFLLCGLFAALAAAIWMISAGLAVYTSPSVQPAIGSLGLVIISAPLYGLIVFLVARTPHPAKSRTQAAPLALSPNESASWNQTMTTPAFAWVAATALVAAIGIIVLGPVTHHNWNAAVISSSAAMTGLALACAALAWLRVTADHRGLRISSRFLPFAARTISLDNMADASSVEIRPAEWGGWGYRVTPSRSAIILRSGEGIVVDLKSGRSFAVTVDDSNTLASVLRGLLH